MLKEVNDMSLQSKLLQSTFKIQKLCGLHAYQNERCMIYGKLNFFTHLVFMGLVVYMICSDLNNISIFMTGIESFNSHIQALMKFLPILLHKKEIKSLIDKLPLFQQTKNADEYKIWIKLSNIYVALFLTTTFFFIAYPGLLFKSYIPDFPHAYTTMIIFQKIQFTYSAFVVMGTDLLYVAFCGIIKVQYQKLKADLDILQKSKNASQILKLWIQQQIFLLNYTKSFARIFSETLLLQYVVSTINLCAELYFINRRGSDGVFIGVLYISSLAFQTSLVCLITAQVTDTASEIADALFFMDWYYFPLNEMKILPLIIQQAQVPVRFVAGGLINIDQRVLTTILQNAYSFYALISQMN